MAKIELGEYTIINELNEGGGLRALRHGEEWLNLAGDNMVLAMFSEIERLTEKLNEAENLMSEAHDLMDDVHCYETDVYQAISKYFNGEEAE